MAATKESEDCYVATARGYELIKSDPDSDDGQLLLIIVLRETVSSALSYLSQTEEGNITKEQFEQHKRLIEKIYDKIGFYVILELIEKKTAPQKPLIPPIKFSVLWEQYNNDIRWSLPFTCKTAADTTAGILRKQAVNKNVRVLWLNVPD